MISARNPMKDRVAFANAATTGFKAHNTDRSPGSLALEACIAVLRDSGLSAADVDGICGTSLVSAEYIQAGLGIPELTWFANPVMPFVNQVSAAASAVYSGLSEVVLMYHPAYRLPWNTASSLRDPFRRALNPSGGVNPAPEMVAG